MIGKLLGGRYEIEKVIGEGGMAMVYRAKDILLHRTVAVKVLRSQFGTDEDFIARFHREAQAAASLSHPNVVNTYDLGQEDGVYYIVMEYVEGGTLKEYITEHAPLPVEDAVNIAIQICDALDHAHHHHIIHRDIKPHNILMGKNGRIKVTDFGIARAVTSATITHTGSVLGSVQYFSPEQAKGIMTDAKSDLYSLGVVLYEMLTGHLPFDGDSPISVALKHLQDPYIHAKELRPELPQSVDNVIVRVMAKDPVFRYETAHEMLEDLRTCLTPERENEPPYQLPEALGGNDDKEITRVIPAIKPDMLRRKWTSEDGKEGLDLAEVKDDGGKDEVKTPQKPWKKWTMWSGATLAVLIVIIVGLYLANQIFNVPDVVVPAVENMPLDQARKILEDKKLVPVIQNQSDPTVPEGTVIKQTPAAKMTVKEKSEVKLIVSQGKLKEAMPKYIGMKLKSIEGDLKTRFQRYEVKYVNNDQYEPGMIIEQKPAANEIVVLGDTTVYLTVNQGTVKMPDLIGLTEADARSKVEGLGLIADITKASSYKTEGTVISQSYAKDSDVPKGSHVSIQVSSGFPSDSKKAIVPINVYLNSGEQANIEIRLTDATVTNQTVEKVTIYQSTRFSVTCILAPSKDATIQVFRNGVPIETQVVKYSDVK